MSESHPQAFEAPSIHELAPLFPGYEIETLIATGGMGAVYRAIQKSLDRTVAIKILPKEFSKDAAFCEGFEAEAKAMAKLNHPNLIGVFDFGEVNGRLYIIMEYVPGQSLFHASNGMAVDPGEVIRLVSGICDGLAHAHENGILHRDIKPSNILLDLEARPKIGDFGLARPMDRKIQEGEEIFGTPHYTAPEVVDAPHTVNNRADIFSVGVLLHELLTSKLPAEDTRPASLICHCDHRFDAIIRRATNPLADARYSNAAEISKELRAIGNSQGPRAARGPGQPVNPTHRPSAGRRSARPVVIRKSSGGGSGIVALLVVAALAVGAFVYFSGKPADKSPNPTVSPPAPSPNPSKPDSKTSSSAQEEPATTPGSEEPSEPAPEVAQEEPETPAAPTTGTSEETTPPPDATALPKFDVPGFYVRARKFMQDRAAPLIKANADGMTKNLTDFDRAAKRLIRRIDSKTRQEAAETALEEFVTECRTNNNRLPAKLGKNFETFRDFAEIHEEYLAKQEAIDATMMEGLGKLTSLYITGLEKQIERLKADNDPAAVKMIEDEVEKSRSNSSHFPTLMLGKDPNAAPEESAEDL